MSAEVLGYAPKEEVAKPPHRANEIDPAERDRLVMKHQGMVRAIAIEYKQKLPVNVELDDLVSSGNVGLLQAIDNYDPTTNVSLANYAQHVVRGRILDHLRQLDWEKRDMRKSRKKFEAAVEELTRELGRPPEDKEVEQKMNLDEDALRKLMIDLAVTGPVSMEGLKRDDKESDVLEPADRHAPNPEHLAMREQMRGQLEDALATLSPRYRELMIKYYSDSEPTMKEIGIDMGVNESRVSQIHKDALRKLAANLREKGFTSSKEFIQ